jgi:DNA ligase 1
MFLMYRMLRVGKQVHKLEDGSVGVFSRNSEDMSKKYPDLVEQLPNVSTSALCASVLRRNRK